MIVYLLIIVSVAAVQAPVPKAHVFAQMQTRESCEQIAADLNKKRQDIVAVCVQWRDS